ncbi:MAG: hypothetical protein WHT65_09675, partial [Pseudothermotoga sp.]
MPHPVWSERAKEAYWHLWQVRASLVPEEQKEAEQLLEIIYQETGHRWKLNEVPDPMPPEDWPEEARAAFRHFWELKREKRQKIDESINRNAPQEV